MESVVCVHLSYTSISLLQICQLRVRPFLCKIISKLWDVSLTDWMVGTNFDLIFCLKMCIRGKNNDETKPYGTTMLTPPIVPFLPNYSNCTRGELKIGRSVQRNCPSSLLCIFSAPVHSYRGSFQLSSKLTSMSKSTKNTDFFGILGKYSANIRNLKKIGWISARRQNELRYPCSNGQVR